MKPKILIGVVLVYIVALLLVEVFIPNEADGKVIVEPTPVVEPSLTPAQIIWLARLMDCESGINGDAVNPNDLDNTPSWGILQFKTGTFDYFTAKYGISADLMNAEAQVSIVTYWLLHPGEVVWEQQFPACVRKLGVPPVRI